MSWAGPGGPDLGKVSLQAVYVMLHTFYYTEYGVEYMNGIDMHIFEP